MSRNTETPLPAGRFLRGAGPWILGLLLLLGLLVARPQSWARPNQAPDYQTIPTLTPTPTSPGQGPTSTPSQPADTPPPTATSRPTDTPVPGQPTNTPAPTASATPAPGQPTATPTPAAPVPTATALPAAPGQPVLPSQCWTFPTPGFQPPRLAGSAFEAESPQSLVVPGQTVELRLAVTNSGNAAVSGLLICNPLDPALKRGQPQASQGQVRLDAQGLIAELGNLAPGKTAQVTISLVVPADQPLGGVVENQAWLFFQGQRAGSNLLTWALPPAFLPPTGQ